MLNWFDHLFEHYGAAAIALGAGLEGEAAVTAGGFLAQRGLIDPRSAALCAFLGSFAVDQALFLSARFHRERAYLQRLLRRPAIGRALGLIDRHPTLFCLVFRFLYGLRIAGPLAIGVSSVPVRRFVVLNAISAAIWAATFTYLGFRFGAAVTGTALTFAKSHVPLLAGVLAIVVAVAGALWVLRRRKATKAGSEVVALPEDPPKAASQAASSA